MLFSFVKCLEDGLGGTDIIANISYKGGMLNSVGERKKLQVIKLKGHKIPEEISKQFFEDNIFELAGEYGDPSLGKPIEYKWMQIEFNDRKYEYEVFNLGILMFQSNDEKIKRLMRCMIKVDRLQNKQENAGIIKKNETTSTSKRIKRRSRRK
jgi:hypothetical protein